MTVNPLVFGQYALDMVNNAKAIIEEQANKNANILVTEELMPSSEYWVPHITVVKMSAVPYEDFYPALGKMRISFAGCRKLAEGLGINWVIPNEGFTERTRDYICFRAAGIRTNSAGQPIDVSQMSDWDRLIEEEEIRDNPNNTLKVEGKAGGKKTEAEIKALIRVGKKFAPRKCESGARARVIRLFAPGLKAAYTKEEIKYPFVVLSYILAPDRALPEMQRLMANMAVEVAGNIYGKTQHQKMLPADVTELPNDEPEIAPTTGAPAAAAEPPQQPDPDTSKAATAKESLLIDFQAMEGDQKRDCIRRMLVEKQYSTNNNPPHLKKAGTDMNDVELLEMYAILVNYVEF